MEETVLIKDHKPLLTVEQQIEHLKSKGVTLDRLHYSGQFHEVREAPEKGWTPWLTRSTPGTSPRSSSGR